jgi:uncharacterized protein YmfQ (DUF2313 family)
MSDRLPPTASLTVADFAQKFQDHLPQGEIWSRDPSAFQSQVILSLLGTYQRLSARDSNLLVDSFPTSTVELITEWEATLGLPDSCTPLNPTFAQRLAAIAARIAAQGGQSVPYFISVAAALGFTITITEFTGSTALAYQWRINSALNTITYFRAGQSVAGDALAAWGNSQLECVMRKIAPAHLTLLFGYS